jgi:type I site-specific restriction endonuclease
MILPNMLEGMKNGANACRQKSTETVHAIKEVIELVVELSESIRTVQDGHRKEKKENEHQTMKQERLMKMEQKEEKSLEERLQVISL